jgi:hypothetical protein
MMVSVVVLVIALGGVYSLFFAGVDTYAIGATQGDLERNAKRVLNRVAEELTLAGVDTVSPVPESPFAGDEVTYQKSLGLVDGVLTWGPAITIQLTHSSEDPPDGVDNNGNGLVDEGVLVLRTNPGEANETTEVLCRWVRAHLEGEVENNVDDNGNGLVDEPGFALKEENGLWTIYLTLEKRDANGRLLTHTLETSVRQRN